MPVSRVLTERVAVQSSLGLNLILTLSFMYHDSAMITRMVLVGLGCLSELASFSLVSMLVGEREDRA